MKKNNVFSLLKNLQPSYGLLSIGFLISLLSTGASLLLPVAAQQVIDFMGKHQGLGFQNFIPIIILFLASGLLSMISMYIFGKVGNQLVARLRTFIWDKFLKLPISYYDHTAPGENVSRLVNDSSLIKEIITNYFPQFVSAIVLTIGTIVILIIMNLKLTLLILVSIPVIFIVMLPLGGIMKKISNNTQSGLAGLTGYLTEILDHMRLIKSSNAEPKENKTGRSQITNLYDLGMQETKINAVISPIMSIILMTVIIFVVGYGGVLVNTKQMTSGQFIAFLLYLFQLVPQLTILVSFSNQVQKISGATDRISTILAIETPVQVTPKPFPAKFESLSFNQVDFTYQDSEKPALSDVDFTVSPGKTYALVGPSGSGKTTILSLIEDYYQPTSGNITLNQTDLAKISLTQWREHLGYVAQENTLLSGTIAENVAFGFETIDEARVLNALQQADAKEFVLELPQGIETKIGSDGQQLSGGQTQRIAIARAFYRDPTILILDEATANLDSGSEARIQTALDRLMQQRTTIISAHRLATIVNADEILFIDHGQITGRGKHEVLYAKHPLYHQFVDQQFKLNDESEK